MINFIIIYLSGYLVSLPIGINIIKQLQSNEKPIFDKSDLDVKIAIKRMSVFIMLISSWLMVFIYLFINTKYGYKFLTKK
jgi:ABC-type uncharacterized transport system permease subunit